MMSPPSYGAIIGQAGIGALVWAIGGFIIYGVAPRVLVWALIYLVVALWSGVALRVLLRYMHARRARHPGLAAEAR